MRALVALFYLLMVGAISGGKIPEDTARSCVRAVGPVPHYAEDGGPETVLAQLPYQKCENTTSYCFALWQEFPNNGSKRILEQGCWVTSGIQEACERSQCLADKRPLKAKNDTKFCCCNGNRCNAEFADSPHSYVPEETSTSLAPETLPRYTISSTIWLCSAAFTVIVTGLILILWHIKRPTKKHDLEGGQHVPPPTEYSLEKLKLLSVIGQGCYGSVWKGVIDDELVAVKVFPAHHRNYFLNEHDLYQQTGNNDALLKCYGGGPRCLVPGGPTEYLLILSLEQECLQEYLKGHTIDLPTLCKMSLGIAKGLAHLHSDIGKPCVAHRDINTRNILVRSDLSCCICDLGLAVIPKRTENRSLSEAGTLRYMAPEVLEGAVNLRDCECALKQIDVYALGLVLWELGTRCVDMQVTEPQPYSPPFHKEAGENPSLEQMQTLVSRRKARPLWPASWKDTAAARLLCETAEDCWDQDAEARLTSLCVVERLLDLPILRGRVLHPMRPPASPTPLINNNHLHDHPITNDASVGTIETLLSPSEENCKNSNQLAAACNATILQPYQGRNPCLERNLLSGSSDSLLIDKSSKHCTSSESQNLIANEIFGFQVNQRATPIPYLQNAVHGLPKQYNTSAGASNTSNKPTKFNWSNFKKLFDRRRSTQSLNQCKETQVKLLPSKLVNSFGHNGVATSLLKEERPSTLPLDTIKLNRSGISQIIKRNDALERQQSLEQFAEVFSSASDVSRLKDPSQHVKTPGDVPPSVRRTRGKAAQNSTARFSLYDDRMMMGQGQQWSTSAPDLDPEVAANVASEQVDRESVSSF